MEGDRRKQKEPRKREEKRNSKLNVKNQVRKREGVIYTVALLCNKNS